uniref:hypothetical protein n=1 Tax=Burkholderia gladioli TaxID=28095 RepID=UPI001640F619
AMPDDKLAMPAVLPATPVDNDATALPVLVESPAIALAVPVERLLSAAWVLSRPVDSEAIDCVAAVDRLTRPVDRLVMPDALPATPVDSDPIDRSVAVDSEVKPFATPVDKLATLAPLAAMPVDSDVTDCAVLVDRLVAA